METIIISPIFNTSALILSPHLICMGGSSLFPCLQVKVLTLDFLKKILKIVIEVKPKKILFNRIELK